MSQIRKRKAAMNDMAGHYRRQAEEHGPESADRFLDSLHMNVLRLAERPLRGFALPPEPTVLTGLRAWPVRGCGDLVIVYRPRADGVDIIRVLQCAGALAEMVCPRRT